MPKSDVNTVLHAKYGDRDFQLWWNVASWHVGESHMHQWHAAQTGPDHPYYKRNWPHLCSFWVKGECKRGEECPYKHEKPTDPDDSLADQNIKDRYYGINDPVADKLLKRASTRPRLDPPEDKTITTLYVGGLGDTITETDLRFVNIILWTICTFTCPGIIFFGKNLRKHDNSVPSTFFFSYCIVSCWLEFL